MLVATLFNASTRALSWRMIMPAMVLLLIGLVGAMPGHAKPVGTPFPHYIKPVCAVGDGGGYGRRVDPETQRVSFHAGLDFDVGAGYPVFAAAAGRVLFAGLRGPYGFAIDVDHGGGDMTRYAHLSALAVTEGQWVPQGATIGWSGATGETRVPVLRFEVWRDNVVHNPGPLIRANSRCWPAGS